MCNHERLLEYLYDELPASARAAMEAHLHECEACRAELAGLGGARLALASWSPPDAELGFRIVRNEPAVARRRWGRVNPAWGLAAAAVLVLSIGAALANLEVQYGAGQFVVRTGWGSAASAVQPAAHTAAVDWSGRLQQLDARLQQLEARETRSVRAASVPDEGARPAGMSDAELLRTVRAIIAESEQRQQRDLALRVTQMVRDFDAARVGDLARVEQGLRQIQGLTDAELIRHRDTLNHLLRVTQQR
jgi:anti-sigma factor RsiW